MSKDFRISFRADALTTAILVGESTARGIDISKLLRMIVLEWHTQQKSGLPTTGDRPEKRGSPEPAEKEGFEPSRRF